MIIKETNIRGWHTLKATLKSSGIAILPAYTMYGFSASLFDAIANCKIFNIKKRSLNNPFLVIASKEYIMDIAVDVNVEILDFLLDSNITVVIRTSVYMPPYVTKHSKTAFRMANTSLLKNITLSFPITSTSVNISGKKSLNSIKTIIERYGSYVDIIVNGKIKNTPSTIVEMEGERVTILREGCCAEKLKEIWSC